MRSLPVLFSVALLACLVHAPANACEVQPADVAAPKLGSDCQPLAGWLSTHERFLVIANRNRAQVVFIGDSITAHWRTRFKEHFLQEFGQYKAANFGIGGDRSQHVLWRVEDALFEASTPKVVVLMIGTNNAKSNLPSEVASGIRNIIDAIHEQSPTTKVLLHAILPRGAAKLAAKNDQVNTKIATFHDGEGVYFLDIGPLFLDADGNIDRVLMPDLLHLSLEGYQVWADAIRHELETLILTE
jgi:lysophospholipase L1-like esterase